ncbi:MAG: hypothetical protein M3Q27_01045 [Actinomycetota bacterium]|nr:hypothetical protein [Actinomycetota bacterium]
MNNTDPTGLYSDDLCDSVADTIMAFAGLGLETAVAYASASLGFAAAFAAATALGVTLLIGGLIISIGSNYEVTECG